LIEQRVRWASKTSNYNLATGKLIGVIVLAGNLIMVISPFLTLLKIMTLKTFISFFLLKLFFDYLLIERVDIFENKKIKFTMFLISSIVYPYFTVFIFLKSMLGRYQWKERTFKM